MGGALRASCDWSNQHLPGREGGRDSEGRAEAGAQSRLRDWLAESEPCAVSMIGRQ